ncbi:MAG: hypothetical protein HFJ45_04570 [Clostridia bacterium]|nr:hypothetical protein [Clostridia bacterium]
MYAEDASTKVIITITSQAGVAAKYNLYIRILENNSELDKVIVDGTEILDYEEETSKYIALIDNSKEIYEIFLMAVNDNAKIELFDNDVLISDGMGSLTETVNIDIAKEGHIYKVKVSLDEENYNYYTLELIRMSNDTSLKLIEVNDVPRTPENEEPYPYVYKVGIPKLAEVAKVKVQTTNSYATVQIGDDEIVKGGSTSIIDLNLDENRITVPVVVTAVDGVTQNTYNILLLRQSNDTSLDSVIVNGKELENIDDVYTYYMEPDEYLANTKISTADNNNATIEVDGNEGIGYLEFDETFEPNTIKVEKTIKVTSEDETIVKEYTLVIVKKTQITGIITTENFEGKYLSLASLYKSGEEEVVTQVETNEDGSYELNIYEVGNYKVVITKPGYLKYTVENIEILPGDIIDLGEYALIAGDTVKSDEIEIDDLVGINDNIGVVITDENKEEKSRYDLNEDGIVDNKDRDILKSNYTKEAEKVEWVKPIALMLIDDVCNDEAILNTDTIEENSNNNGIEENGDSSIDKLILPMKTQYVITSEYGYRTHPTTGEYKKNIQVLIYQEFGTLK